MVGWQGCCSEDSRLIKYQDNNTGVKLYHFFIIHSHAKKDVAHYWKNSAHPTCGHNQAESVIDLVQG